MIDHIVENIEEGLGCFKCGSLNPDIRINDHEGFVQCESCGEQNCIITFQQAIDLVIDAQQRGYLPEFDPNEAL